MSRSARAAIEVAVIGFYREEIRGRYEVDNVRQFEEFDAIPDETIKALRDFFLERVYPPKDVRDELDAAFAHLGSLLRSPMRLAPLVRSALLSMLRMGPHMPAAIAAGIAAVDAFRKTHALEAEMMEEARQLGIDPGNATDRLRMLGVIASVPEESVRSLIREVITLFHALSHAKMLAGLLRLIERCLRSMEARPDLYAADEREGITYALEVLQGGHDLLLRINAKDLPRLLKGIEKVETVWYEEVCEEVRNSG